MAIERAMGRHWRMRVAALAALATGASAHPASADVIAVGHAQGHGVGHAVAVANRTPTPDTLVFHGARSDRPFPVPSELTITEPLRLLGNERVVLKGRRDSSEIRFMPRDRRHRAKRLRIDTVDLRRIQVSALDDGEGHADMTVVHSTITGTGTGTGVAFDGAFYGGKVVLEDTTVSGFRTGVSLIYTDEPLRIVDSTISGNGLGISISQGRAELLDSTVSDNAPGGGITASYYAGAGITGSTISGNEDSEHFGNLDHAIGGGVDAGYMAGGSITNSTITGNSAAGPGGTGGGVYGNFRVLGSTITGNTAANGGGIAEYGGYSTQDYVLDSIVAGNTATTGPDCFKAVVSRGHNLFGLDGCGTADAPGDIRTSDPMLAPLAFNGGGLTQTRALLPGSPAIGAGIADERLTTDQRGVARADPPDIGAFELP
jgi:hypothetical protein